MSAMPPRTCPKPANGLPVRRDDVVCRVLDDEAVLYDAVQDAVQYLNQTAWFIWSRCDGQSGLDDLVLAVIEAFDAPDNEHEKAAIREDVAHTLDHLAEAGLIRFVEAEDS